MREAKTMISADKITELASELSKIDCSKYAPVKLQGSLAIAEQKVWIENKTIKDIILFGKDLNE